MAKKRAPAKSDSVKIKLNLRLDPEVIEWAKAEAPKLSAKMGLEIGYQTFINMQLRKLAGAK